MLRIIAGNLKNRKIERPSIEQTRPTKEIVREAIFSSLFNKIEGAIVLDLCAGSGVMSFEAISRGAMKSIIVDKSIEACRVIKTNAVNLRVSNFDLYRKDALDFLRFKRGAKFDIIFIDPPYSEIKLYNSLLAAIVENNQLSDTGVIVLECEDVQNITLPKKLIANQKKGFGRSEVLFLSKIL